jgi:Fas apoptotic inhibitory molecule (FAIM1)
MRFSFEIGDVEKNTVEFQFSQLFGRTVIRVNGKELRRTRRLFSEPLRDNYEFTIGEKESFAIRIEKERRLIFGSKYRVYINRRLLAVHQGH